MIKDKPNRIVKWFATQVAERWIIRHFARVKFIGEPVADPGRSCMLLMNHFSFNDGAIMHRICRKILKKDFKVMVVEAQLKAFPGLRNIGCFSVDKKSRNMIESLNYAAGLLDRPATMLGIYPQGEVYSMHLNRVHFESGLNYILKKAQLVPYQVFFGVTLLDYLDSFKPVARVYLMEYNGERRAEKMEEAYNAFYAACKLKQQQLHEPPERVRDQNASQPES